MAPTTTSICYSLAKVSSRFFFFSSLFLCFRIFSTLYSLYHQRLFSLLLDVYIFSSLFFSFASSHSNRSIGRFNDRCLKFRLIPWFEFGLDFISLHSMYSHLYCIRGICVCIQGKWREKKYGLIYCNQLKLIVYEAFFFRLVNTSNGMHGTRITYTIWYFLYGESNVRQCNPWQQKIASHPPLRKKERNDGKPHRCFDPKRLRSKHINSSSLVTHSPFSKYTPFQISNSFFLVYTPLLKPRRKLNMHIFYSKFLSFL